MGYWIHHRKASMDWGGGGLGKAYLGGHTWEGIPGRAYPIVIARSRERNKADAHGTVASSKLSSQNVQVL